MFKSEGRNVEDQQSGWPGTGREYKICQQTFAMTKIKRCAWTQQLERMSRMDCTPQRFRLALTYALNYLRPYVDDTDQGLNGFSAWWVNAW